MFSAPAARARSLLGESLWGPADAFGFGWGEITASRHSLWPPTVGPVSVALLGRHGAATSGVAIQRSESATNVRYDEWVGFPHTSEPAAVPHLSRSCAELPRTGLPTNFRGDNRVTTFRDLGRSSLCC